MIIILDTNERNLIGPYLKALRIKSNLTQEELSVKLETHAVYINRSSISKLENQKRIVTDIEISALAQVLNVNVNQLFAKD